MGILLLLLLLLLGFWFKVQVGFVGITMVVLRYFVGSVGISLVVIPSLNVDRK